MSSGYSFWGGGVEPGGQVISSGAYVIMNPGQISVYDDFVEWNIGNNTNFTTSGGLWVVTNSTAGGTVTPTTAQQGIVNCPPNAILNGNLNKAGYIFSNITKIVARFVFLITLPGSYASGQEATVGFTHTGTQTADGSNNLYGSFINFCPGYGGQLPDWDTRALLTTPQLTGFTYGLYAGTTTGGLAGFGYKPSALVTSVSASTWYEGIISMIPGVSAKFYIGSYGSPTLDRTCAIAAQIPNVNSAGPIITMATNGLSTPGLQIDKCQYAMWFSEGNKQLTDDQMFAL